MEKGRRIMAIDLGTKKIGLAISDESLTLAQPLAVLKREGNKKDIPKIVNIVESHNIGTVVIGVPVSDKQSFMAKSAERFGSQLKEASHITIEFIDETMTTAESYEILKMAGVNTRKGKQIVDKVAATKILESYLRLKGHSRK